MTTKVIRTPKKWTEECRECCGSGYVHKREHFALWTPDEYMATMPECGPPKLDAKHDVPADAVVCSAMGGSTIFEACAEGVGLAKVYGRPVAFEFNGAVAICRADSDPNTVAKVWWKRAYGKTYEQAMKER